MNINGLDFLKQISGIGEKRFATISHIMMERQMQIADIRDMSTLQIKSMFSLPIHIASALSNAVQEKYNSIDNRKSKQDVSLNRNILEILINTAQYPQRLINILGENTPSRLYVWGNLDLLDMPSIGFCGSRSVSERGLQVTSDIAQQAVNEGWVIISGHAKGVDTTAHVTALENGGNTIVVIAEGMEKFKLRQEIKRIAKPENILIISEFPPQSSWNVGYAMQRNKTIVALSNAMMLIESRTEGGSFDAGKQELNLNIPLFVAEYENQINNNAGNAYFLKRGAKRVLKNKDTNRANLDELKNVFNVNAPFYLNDAVQMPLFQDIQLHDKK